MLLGAACRRSWRAVSSIWFTLPPASTTTLTLPSMGFGLVSFVTVFTSDPIGVYTLSSQATLDGPYLLVAVVILGVQGGGDVPDGRADVVQADGLPRGHAGGRGDLPRHPVVRERSGGFQGGEEVREPLMRGLRAGGGDEHVQGGLPDQLPPVTERRLLIRLVSLRAANVQFRGGPAGRDQRERLERHPVRVEDAHLLERQAAGVHDDVSHNPLLCAARGG